MQVLVVMVALTVLMVALTVWMSRQILRPAEELERSRTELRQMYEAARADSLRDGLTGLGNHRAFQEELDRELEWYHRYRVPVALLLIDLDDLKLVNDSDGHAAGDEMLRDMGRLIGEVARYADRAFRIGGDEFADPDAPHRRRRRAADRPAAPGAGHAAARRRPADPVLGRHLGLSRAAPRHASQLYAQADAALYWCKRHGRASVDVFHPVRDRAASQEATNELSAADRARSSTSACCGPSTSPSSTSPRAACSASRA